MLSVPLGKYHHVDWVSWAPGETLAIVPQTHAGISELSVVDLSSGAARHLDDVLGNGMHHADLASLTWASNGTSIRVRVARLDENGTETSRQTMAVAVR